MANVTATKDNCKVGDLFQWDRNQELAIRGLSLSGPPEVHFAHDNMDVAIVCEATMDDEGVIHVEVPNSLLEKPYKINAYVCVKDGDVFNTLRRIVIPVIAREQPDDIEEG